MVKEGKKRITITLEEPIARHLEVWMENGYAHLKNKQSYIINMALYQWMVSKGDTFNGWKK